jgi:hypothetical protein
MIAHGKNGPDNPYPRSQSRARHRRAAAFSVDVRSGDQISADGCFPSAGKVALPSRRGADAAHIPCFTVEKITAPIACTAAGTVLRFISQPAPAAEKAGAKPGHVPNKGEAK